MTRDLIWTGLESVRERLERFAPQDVRVLLTGESGTGKSQIAEWIHRNSRRKDRKLEKIACPALPGELFESELFGHVKGAFTGARDKKRGRVEIANGGTLFLEEVGELVVERQSKLLAFLDDGVITPLGATAGHPADVRVISATHRDLEREIEGGGCRDLDPAPTRPEDGDSRTRTRIRGGQAPGSRVWEAP